MCRFWRVFGDWWAQSCTCCSWLLFDEINVLLLWIHFWSWVHYAIYMGIMGKSKVICGILCWKKKPGFIRSSFSLSQRFLSWTDIWRDACPRCKFRIDRMHKIINFCLNESFHSHYRVQRTLFSEILSTPKLYKKKSFARWLQKSASLLLQRLSGNETLFFA